jgi:hypothetical protein
MNARKEIERAFGLGVKCAAISISNEDLQIAAKLKIGYTEQEKQEFLNTIDVEYDAGYGAQELFGRVWLNDGTWFSRWEYDGSEGWQHHFCPKIPIELQ